MYIHNYINSLHSIIIPRRLTDDYRFIWLQKLNSTRMKRRWIKERFIGSQEHVEMLLVATVSDFGEKYHSQRYSFSYWFPFTWNYG